MIEIEARLSELRALGLERRMRLVSGPQGPHVLLDGKRVLLLCSDNYLGLADHPRVRDAAAEAAMRWGAGAGASRLVSGTMTIHRRLEEGLADFEHRQSALLFGSGYLANASVIAALARPGDVVFSDAQSHPSIADGCRLSGAQEFAYDHCDIEHLEWGIRKTGGRGVLIATESVFAMDGNMAPLDEIAELAHRRGLRVLVDESHAIGTIGPGGRGALADLGLEHEVDVIVGTLGKALGSYGAFVACDRPMARYLAGAARTLVYSTAPAPPAASAALAALELLQERPQLLDRLTANVLALREELEREQLGAGLVGSPTPIVPVVVGEPHLATEISGAALARGVFVQAILPPTVPPARSLLRLAAMAPHRPEELRAAARILGQLARAAGADIRRATDVAETDYGRQPEEPEPEVLEPEPPEFEEPEFEAPPPGVFDFEERAA